MQSLIKRYYSQKTDYGMNSLRREKILKLVGSIGKKNILDLGCASGYLARELKRTDNFVAGLDISDKFAQTLKNDLDYFAIFDIEEDIWPQEFLTDKFDLIIGAEVIEHLFSPQEFLKKIKKVLKPGGEVIITTPNFLVWNNRLRMLLGQYGNKEKFFDQGHINLFSYCGFKKLLRENDYQVLAEDNVWYPNSLDKYKNFLPANIFVFQLIVKIKPQQ